MALRTIFSAVLFVVCEGHGGQYFLGSDPSARSVMAVSGHVPTAAGNVTTLRGARHDGSREHSGVANVSHLAHLGAVRIAGDDCGRPEVAAALASFSCYDSGAVEALVPKSDLEDAVSALKNGGFSLAKKFVHAAGSCPSIPDPTKIVDDTDAAHLWKRSQDRHCLLAFRGSNCLGDGFAGLKDPTHIFKYGHTIHQMTLVEEFEPLLEKMSKQDFADCTTLDVAGHSLGAALASIFAVLSNDGELHLDKYVDQVHLFSTPKVFFGDEMLRNGQRDDGCFPGGMYCNYIEKNGKFKVDWVCHEFKGFQTLKSDFVKIGATTGTIPCAQVTDEVLAGDEGQDGLDVHLPQHYVTNLGCSEAIIPVRAHL